MGNVRVGSVLAVGGVLVAFLGACEGGPGTAGKTGLPGWDSLLTDGPEEATSQNDPGMCLPCDVKYKCTVTLQGETDPKQVTISPIGENCPQADRRPTPVPDQPPSQLDAGTSGGTDQGNGTGQDTSGNGTDQGTGTSSSSQDDGELVFACGGAVVSSSTPGHTLGYWRATGTGFEACFPQVLPDTCIVCDVGTASPNDQTGGGTIDAGTSRDSGTTTFDASATLDADLGDADFGDADFGDVGTVE